MEKRKLTTKFDPEHMVAIDRLAEAAGVSRSEAIRLLVAEYAELAADERLYHRSGSTPPPPAHSAARPGERPAAPTAAPRRKEKRPFVREATFSGNPWNQRVPTEMVLNAEDPEPETPRPRPDVYRPLGNAAADMGIIDLGESGVDVQHPRTRRPGGAPYSDDTGKRRYQGQR